MSSQQTLRTFRVCHRRIFVWANFVKAPPQRKSLHPGWRSLGPVPEQYRNSSRNTRHHGGITIHGASHEEPYPHIAYLGIFFKKGFFVSAGGQLPQYRKPSQIADSPPRSLLFVRQFCTQKVNIFLWSSVLRTDVGAFATVRAVVQPRGVGH